MLLTSLIPRGRYNPPVSSSPDVERAVAYVWTVAVTRLAEHHAAPHAIPVRYGDWLADLDPPSFVGWTEYERGSCVIIPVTPATAFVVPRAHLDYAMDRHQQDQPIVDPLPAGCAPLWATLRTAPSASAVHLVCGLLAAHEGECYGQAVAKLYTRTLEALTGPQVTVEPSIVEGVISQVAHDGQDLLVARPVPWLWAGPEARLVTRVTLDPALQTAITAQANAREYPLVWTEQPTSHTDDRQLQLTT